MALGRGEIIAYPTETVYGLGVDPFQPRALERLASLKERDEGKGLILLVNGRGGCDKLARTIPPMACRLMDAFWPGPLTLVLPARPGLSPWITGQGGGVAVRHSPAPLVKALLREWGAPLVSTSANPAGMPPLLDAAAIRRMWPAAQVAVVLEDDAPFAGDPSTVVDLSGRRIRLLREGAVPFSEIMPFLAAVP